MAAHAQEDAKGCGSVQFSPWAYQDASGCAKDVGGYLQNTIKEILRVDRNTKKLLKRCSKPSSCIRFNEIPALAKSSARSLARYFITLDGLYLIELGKQKLDSNEKIGKRSEFKSWPIGDAGDDAARLRDALNGSKERISIDKAVLGFISRVKTAQTSSDVVLEPLHATRSHSRWKLDVDAITDSVLYSKPSIDFKPMPNRVDMQLDEIFDEPLRRSLSFEDASTTSHHSTEFMPLLGSIAQRYYIDHRFTLGTSDVKRKSLSEFKEWDVKAPETDSTLLKLQIECREEKFNEVIFYKIKQAKIPFKAHTTHKNPLIGQKKKWKLSPESLRAMQWDPFKNIKNVGLPQLLDSESIGNNTFRIPVSTLRFDKLKYATIDLISNLGSKTMLWCSMENHVPVTNNSMRVMESEQDRTQTDPQNTSSSLDITNASMIPEKRSMIDESLMSIVEKKKCKRQSVSASDVNIPSLELLSSVFNKSDIYEEDAEPGEIEADLVARPLTPCLENRPELTGKCIIINWDKIHENHTVLQKLCNYSALTVIERNLPYDCDFIINGSACVVRIKIQMFFQINDRNELHYADTISNLVDHFVNVIVLLEYSQELVAVDPDLFFKAQLVLQQWGAESYLAEGSDAVSMWILDLAIDSPSFCEADFEQTTDDEKILTDLGINILAAKEINSITPACEFLVMPPLERFQRFSNLVPDFLLSRVSSLMSMSW